MPTPNISQASNKTASKSGLWRSWGRTWSGLILFIFVLTHLLNHALGLISIEMMDIVQTYRVAIWRSMPGTIVLYGALIVHASLSLFRVARQRAWRMKFWQVVQLGFGVTIPFLLFRHVLGTRGAYEFFGVNDSYSDYALWVMWPGEAYNQAALISLVWIHGCVGLHFWLRLKPWYHHIKWLLYGGSVLTPVLAFAGFSVAGRQVRNAGVFNNPFTAEQLQTLKTAMAYAFWMAVMVIGAVLVFRLARTALEWLKPRIKVTYAHGASVISSAGPSLLDISRNNNIPHASVCGGRARCSTCRVRILSDPEELPPPEIAERRVLDRIGAGHNVRLACQLVPRNDISVATLLPATGTGPTDGAIQDKYAWGVEQTVSIMFSDIRGFTTLSENKLPFDVVFLLNQFMSQMGKAIEDADGYIDKLLGDGIMAIFGIDRTPAQGARDALLAARNMGMALDTINDKLATDLTVPLNFGIGIHTGSVILGRIGDAGHQSLTALGDTVNTASRLEASSKELKAQLVVSAETLDASGFALIKKQKRVAITLRGKENKTSVIVIPKASEADFGDKKPGA